MARHGREDVPEITIPDSTYGKPRFADHVKRFVAVDILNSSWFGLKISTTITGTQCRLSRNQEQTLDISYGGVNVGSASKTYTIYTLYMLFFLLLPDYIGHGSGIVSSSPKLAKKNSI